MPANIGEMFYHGEMPWHKEGIGLQHPADLEEALKVGGLNWEVGDMALLTADMPPSPVLKRKALVRLDRPPGHEGRVVGVAHNAFQPFQNHEAGALFDAIFGHGKRVYHTGGYLGRGEVVWLMAKIDRTLSIGGEDVVQPYALMANSHDGSRAFQMKFTPIRVVCQNTLSLAISESLGAPFKRSHQGSFNEHAQAAQKFFSATMKELDGIAESYTALSKQPCPDTVFYAILEELLPDPKRPVNADRNPAVLRMWETKRANTLAARSKVLELRSTGMGAGLRTARGTMWGGLNAVVEFVDHHQAIKGSRIGSTLLGPGMDLKIRAFRKFHGATINKTS